MAFDQTTRNRLNSFVSEARILLTDEFARQLQSDYGIDPNSGRIDDVDSIPHLDDRQRETARILRDTLHHYTAGKSDKKTRVATIDRIVREQAFTVLNRLAALRMAEARGLLIESIAEGTRSDGFQLYQQLAGVALGETDEAYVAYLFSLFDEFAVDLPVLFDRFSPQGRLFPRGRVLRQLLELINDFEIARLWAEDETIGWIYQYFNSSEERRAMRKASSAPRNSRELAVRNQFFTPRYVVEFLTDNTLGRIWYEMTKGQTRLIDECDYLVRRPHEMFLEQGETAPEQEQDDDLTQEELVQQTVYIPHRPLKDPREIRMLDPACGSMHFGLYAFDLFETIYEEAWELEEVGAWADSYPDKDGFMLDVPRLIIEHNIHGIDIDARAAQIAGLSLWLRAQRSWQTLEVPAAERPTVTRSNIVVAEPMPGDEAELEAFLSAQFGESTQDQIVAGLIQRVFAAMKLAGEAGALLKIEEEIADDIVSAREKWTAQPIARQVSLFEQPKQGSLSLPVAVPKVGDEQFWGQVETRIYGALQQFSEQTVQGENYLHRLFAEDTTRGFALIDICRQSYDVVLMNPPFGEPSKSTKIYLRTNYPLAKSDLYPAFISRWARKLSKSGRLGAITSRSAFFLSTFREWREEFLQKSHPMSIFADLGQGVLDNAMVETAAYCVTNNITSESQFFDLRKIDIDLKNSEILRIIANVHTKNHTGNDRFHMIDYQHFSELPGTKYSYWIQPQIRRAFRYLSQLETGDTQVIIGPSTGDDQRYIRLVWEVPRYLVSEQWVWLNKGGSATRYHFNYHLVIDWDRNRNTFRGFLGRRGRMTSRPNGLEYFFLPSISWPLRTQSGFNCRVMPQGFIFSHKGPSILNPDQKFLLKLLSLSNSSVFEALVDTQVAFGSYEVGAIKVIPTPNLSHDDTTIFAELGKKSYAAKQKIDALEETSPLFTSHLTIRAKHSSLKQLYSDYLEQHKTAQNTLTKLQLLTNQQAEEKYNIVVENNSVSGRMLDEPNSISDFSELVMSYLMGLPFGLWDICYVTGDKEPPSFPNPFDPLPTCPPGMLQNSVGLPATPENVSKDYPLRISWPGILVDDDGHREDVIGRIRETLQVIWGGKADDIEAEVCDLLGADSLRGYFSNPNKFFADHLSRYSKSRRVAPIYWPLTTQDGNYTLWLYYHRLHDGILYQCVNDFIDPKLAAIQRQLDGMRSRASKDEDEFARLTDLAVELETFRKELLELAKFWRPNLNDGVEITAAPLYALFGNRKWRDRLEGTWGKLQEEEYDWAHLAMSIWPSRVIPKCVEDRSLAIAHDIEKLFWVEEDESWRPLGAPTEEEARQIEIREADERDRLRQLFGDLAASNEGYLPAMQVWQSLAEGEWDDRPLGLHLYPARAAEAAYDNAVNVFPHLAQQGKKLLQKGTQKNKRLLTKRLLARGTPELVDAVEETLAEETIDFATLWRELEQGKRDKLPLALELWPKRVVGKALHDADLATRQNLFDFYWYDEPGIGARRRQPIKREISHEVERRGGDRL